MTFGSLATIENENIEFKGEVLITDDLLCGIDTGNILVLLYYVFDFPVIYPSASMTLPLHMYLGCGNLTFSA